MAPAAAALDKPARQFVTAGFMVARHTVKIAELRFVAKHYDGLLMLLSKVSGYL